MQRIHLFGALIVCVILNGTGDILQQTVSLHPLAFTKTIEPAKQRNGLHECIFSILKEKLPIGSVHVHKNTHSLHNNYTLLIILKMNEKINNKWATLWLLRGWFFPSFYTSIFDHVIAFALYNDPAARVRALVCVGLKSPTKCNMLNTKMPIIIKNNHFIEPIAYSIRSI